MSAYERADETEAPAELSKQDQMAANSSLARSNPAAKPLMRRVGRFVGRHSWFSIIAVAMTTWGLAVSCHGGDFAESAKTVRLIWLALSIGGVLGWLWVSWLVRNRPTVQRSVESKPSKRSASRPTGWVVIMVVWGALHATFPNDVPRPPWPYRPNVSPWQTAGLRTRKTAPAYPLTDAAQIWAAIVPRLRDFSVTSAPSEPKNAVEFYRLALACWKTRLEEAKRFTAQFVAAQADAALLEMVERHIREQEEARLYVEAFVSENETAFVNAAAKDAADLWQAVSAIVLLGKLPHPADETSTQAADLLGERLASISDQRADWIAMQQSLQQKYPGPEFPLPPDPVEPSPPESMPSE